MLSLSLSISLCLVSHDLHARYRPRHCSSSWRDDDDNDNDDDEDDDDDYDDDGGKSSLLFRVRVLDGGGTETDSGLWLARNAKSFSVGGRWWRASQTACV